MKETKALDKSVSHCHTHLKILVFVMNLLGITVVVAGVTALAAPTDSLLFWIGFQVFFLSVALLLSLLPLISAVRANLRSAEALQATQEDCDAGDALDRWRMKHWLTDWNCQKAQELVRKRIEARERFLDTHPYIKDRQSYLICFQTLLR